eukprot:CAMPEP_0167757262 /NCGR_PEP_ID=MMETSP0110_2-20121227/9827_1 /TAXON_ID=629695 /ORGANISM="Gymnochlora sp., Strain CCMP2014" /LENGTH=316 /DNA_ID=CAMNT_0007643431 /DNA_START=26 /DNA_END=976 /DNA_ORIENTATION=+
MAEKRGVCDWNTIDVSRQDVIDPETGEIMGKRKRKKILRFQKSRAERPAKRQAYREKRREKRRLETKKRKEFEEKMIKEGRVEELKELRLQKKKEREAVHFRSREEMKEIIDKSPIVVIDLSFDDYMSTRQAASLSTQIRYCYGTLMRTKTPFQLWLCGMDEMNGKTPKVLKKDSGYDRWLMKKSSKSYMDEFDQKKLVYLTADSETILSELNPDDIYIIGGIVDKNIHKGLCKSIAAKQKIRTAQLPISQYLVGSTRKVITVNQVFSILVKFREIGDWGKAFIEVMPPRKGFSLRKDTESSSLSSKKEIAPEKLN